MWHTYSEAWKKERQTSCANPRQENENGRTTYCTISTTCIYLVMSGVWKKNSNKTPNKIVRSQRQLSVNCPTSQAITNCWFVLPIITASGEERRRRRRRKKYVAKMKPREVDLMYGSMWCLWLWSSERHQPNHRIGRNWQRKIIE